jgi:prevent-host-death family protein
MIDKTKNTGRPILITQNGKGSAVLIDVDLYEQILEKLELAGKISKSEEQIRTGKVLSHKEIMDKLKLKSKKNI